MAALEAGQGQGAGQGSNSGQGPSRKALPHLQGEGGSIINIFRVLLPGRSGVAQLSLGLCSACSGTYALPEHHRPHCLAPLPLTPPNPTYTHATPGGLQGRSKLGEGLCQCKAHEFGDGHCQRCESGRTASGVPLQRFPPGSFDVIVDTFGLCSHEDPVLVSGG